MKLYGRPGELYVVVVNETFLGHSKHLKHSLSSVVAHEGDMLFVLSCVANSGLTCLLLSHSSKKIVYVSELRLRDVVEFNYAKEIYR